MMMKITHWEKSIKIQHFDLNKYVWIVLVPQRIILNTCLEKMVTPIVFEQNCYCSI